MKFVRRPACKRLKGLVVLHCNDLISDRLIVDRQFEIPIITRVILYECDFDEGSPFAAIGEGIRKA
ncbi:hypothetical protein C7B61_04775 [filamentous cyanobacterium CCP1]|nr:hypothetical protein C7B76_30825 [filamentous cyanobacterium CCP2]PSB67704.1 hypothetical protein C7B61_04775 [filamentous cyanobacterium CCP1]